MKTKLGFITNSSSSSFIVAWDKKVEKIEDVKKYMTFALKRQIEVIFDEIQNQEPLVIKPNNFDFDFDNVLGGITDKIFGIINSGSFPGIKNPSLNTNREEWDLIDKENEKIALKLTKQFLTEAQGKVIYYFHYSDDTDFWGEMEHGDLFRNLQHLRISHH